MAIIPTVIADPDVPGNVIVTKEYTNARRISDINITVDIKESFSIKKEAYTAHMLSSKAKKQENKTVEETTITEIDTVLDGLDKIS